MSGFGFIDELDALTDQTEDSLLTESEAHHVLELIGSEQYFDTVRSVVTTLCSLVDAGDFHTKEIFFISQRSDIKEALSATRNQISQIMQGSCRQDHIAHIFPETIMAFALNQILVRMADERGLQNIYHSEESKKYIIGVTTKKEKKANSRGYQKTGKARALKGALGVRKALQDERTEVKREARVNLNREKLRQGLIEKGILVLLIQDSKTNGVDTQAYKVSHIYLRKVPERSGREYIFSARKGGKTSSKKATLSVHQGEAYDQVIEAFSDFFGLSLLEQSILKEDQYRDPKLYEEVKK